MTFEHNYIADFVDHFELLVGSQVHYPQVGKITNLEIVIHEVVKYLWGLLLIMENLQDANHSTIGLYYNTTSSTKLFLHLRELHLYDCCVFYYITLFINFPEK